MSDCKGNDNRSSHKDNAKEDDSPSNCSPPTKSLDEYDNLLEVEKNLDDQLKELQSKQIERQQVMNALHEYNDLKDAAQIVLGRLACLEGTTVAHIHRQYGIEDDE
ncbi:DNA repair protein SWI5 homolog [Adelges cooleyi]|uniref:DNA repair protein SWI5 homolog n=1 Tax=Adelges cooleyi TaxID=133065 RepID=UPI00217FFF1D|nr:DNA repair protein SWI5 homolog [Adelges cooleyi]